MDLQTYINNTISASRKESLAKSDQLTLGELILKMEPIVEKQTKRDADSEAMVVYDFGYLYPTAIDSWRGSYEELALDYTEDGNGKMTASEFLKLLKETVGATFEGYKGGEFTMNKHTPVWVANYGHSGSTAVIEVVDNEYEIILITGYRKF